MPTIEGFAPGEFCWIELATSNQNAAKSFYTALFGWTVRDVPMGASGVYSLLELEGRIAAGAFAISESEAAAGVPPHWHLYVAVASADEAAKRAGELGGKVMEAPFDVGDRGRAALIQDPTGAFFSVWEAKQRSGVGVTGEPGSFCWADLTTGDQARAKTFYESLFGWKLTLGKGRNPATCISLTERSISAEFRPRTKAAGTNRRTGLFISPWRMWIRRFNGRRT